MTDARTLVPVGVGRPGRRPTPHAEDCGAVSVEAAFGVLALLTVTVALAWMVSLLGAQLTVGEAARAAARVAGRGDDAVAVRAEARRLVPDADVDLRVEGDHVVVSVSRAVSPPGLMARWGRLSLRAESVALLEQAP